MGDPIEDLRRACEVIRASTGARDPRYVVVPATLWARLEAYADEQRARRRRPGIDS